MEILILIIPVFILIIFLAYYFDNKQVVVRTLKKLPSSGISGIRTNQLTKVTGKALHVEEPLVAPFSKRKCIFYRIKIEEKRHTGKSSHWATLVKDERFQPFFIERNGEYVIVNPSRNPINYKAHLVIDKKTSSGFFKESTPEFEQLLKEYNVRSKGFLGFKKSIRYQEAIIEIGEEVTVAGIAKWKNLNEPIEGYSYSKIASLENSEKQKIIITDLPKEKVNKRL
ncbi:E3 ubiquitin ligase [Tenacibaculum skagerrakense]|uniref:RING-type E3 ubiquitin transferase n=1 Tax=Tenacibaculum skagerrakense TaxID=186571 RepID=A0A4R2P0S0_9FLAO|nr:E3 ubiquitin ligase [Tenacibaculum skagerrakense]